MGHIDAPKLKHLVIIDPHRIELYWDQEIYHQDIHNAYQIKKENQILTINDEDSDWAIRPIYESIKKRTTLYLNESLSLNQMNSLSLIITGEIKNQQGLPAEKKSYAICHWQDTYTRFTQSKRNILIKSSNTVSREAHRKASEIIDTLLVKMPQVAQQLVTENAQLAIYGKEEDCYDIPEHRGGSDILGRPAEGFGGCIGNPVTSISEANILRIIDGPHQTRYTNECILVHEFGHAIHLIGINQLADQSLANELKYCYQHAVDNNLWPDTYIISNYEEYFATLTTIWFNVMAESASGTWDGVRGPINRREELKIYDPEGFNFFSKIYPQEALPYPWHETPNLYPMLDTIKDGSINTLFGVK